MTPSGITPYLFGSSTCLYEFETKIDAQYFGVRFRPGLLPIFDDYLIVDLIDDHIKLDHLEVMKKLGDELFLSSSIENKLKSFLTSGLQFHHEAYLSPLISDIINSSGDIDISATLKKIGKSTRQIERRFKETTGLSAQKLCSIMRFNRARDLLPSHNLSEIALLCGYFDQSHMTNEFKKFTGKTPSQFS